MTTTEILTVDMSTVPKLFNLFYFNDFVISSSCCNNSRIWIMNLHIFGKFRKLQTNKAYIYMPQISLNIIIISSKTLNKKKLKQNDHLLITRYRANLNVTGTFKGVTLALIQHDKAHPHDTEIDGHSSIYLFPYTSTGS